MVMQLYELVELIIHPSIFHVFPAGTVTEVPMEEYSTFNTWLNCKFPWAKNPMDIKRKRLRTMVFIGTNN
jgi:hypothetical protein